MTNCHREKAVVKMQCTGLLSLSMTQIRPSMMYSFVPPRVHSPLGVSRDLTHADDVNTSKCSLFLREGFIF